MAMMHLPYTFYQPLQQSCLHLTEFTIVLLFTECEENTQAAMPRP